jgi:hypothetical protein
MMDTRILSLDTKLIGSVALLGQKAGLALRTFGTVLVLCGTSLAAAQTTIAECGSLENAYGPFDYTDPANSRVQPGGGESPLSLVEGGHFNSDVENLVRGLCTVDPLGDLEYTLKAFPNHHRALYAMANYYLRSGLGKHGRYSIDCWFERAIRFRPEDPVVHVVHGIFLARSDRKSEALDAYKEALRLDEMLTEAHYNIGLLYVELKDYKAANRHALEAYRLGYPLPGLKSQLVAAGVWQDTQQEE